MSSKPQHLDPTGVTTRRVVAWLEEHWECIEFRAVQSADPIRHPVEEQIGCNECCGCRPSLSGARDEELHHL